MPKALARTDPNTMTTTFDRQRSTPLITGQSWQQFGATALLAHELIHVFTNAPNAGVYGHLQMAQAASAAANEMGTGIKNHKLTLPTVDPKNDQVEWSSFYHGIQKDFCERDF